jgi:hypothetical protein
VDVDLGGAGVDLVDVEVEGVGVGVGVDLVEVEGVDVEVNLAGVGVYFAVGFACSGVEVAISLRVEFVGMGVLAGVGVDFAKFDFTGLGVGAGISFVLDFAGFDFAGSEVGTEISLVLDFAGVCLFDFADAVGVFGREDALLIVDFVDCDGFSLALDGLLSLNKFL